MNYYHYAPEIKSITFDDTGTIVVVDSGSLQLPPINTEYDGKIAFYIDSKGLWVHPKVAIDLLNYQWEKALKMKEYHSEAAKMYHRQAGVYRLERVRLEEELATAKDE